MPCPKRTATVGSGIGFNFVAYFAPYPTIRGCVTLGSDIKTRFIVVHGKGPSWDPTKLRREQAQWNEHAGFMDRLTAEGFILLGGPLGEGDGDDAMLVVDAPDEETVVSRLKDDPWKQSGMLVVKSIQRWTIFLEAEGK